MPGAVRSERTRIFRRARRASRSRRARRTARSSSPWPANGNSTCRRTWACSWLCCPSIHGPGYGMTLPEMVEEARAAAAGSGSLHLLNERLDLCGYGVDDAGLYADVGYGIRSFRAFLVGDGFPRIVPGDLPSGVGEVRYSVSMAACAPLPP